METKKIITINKKAKRDYFIENTIEAGICLLGTEVKSIRLGSINIEDSYAEIRNGEIYLVNAKIAKYPYAKFTNHDPERDRKLLLHKREIKRLIGKVSQPGYTIIPLSVYFKNGRIKVEIAVAKGKTKIDRRHEIREKEDKKMMKDARRKKIY